MWVQIMAALVAIPKIISSVTGLTALVNKILKEKARFELEKKQRRRAEIERLIKLAKENNDNEALKKLYIEYANINSGM